MRAFQKRQRALAAVRGIVMATLAVVPAFAAERHVAANGLDTNPGTAEAPWRTIQKAADSVVAGDVVNIRAGTYSAAFLLSEGWRRRDTRRGGE